MVSAFGKYMRNLRTNRDITMRDMARDLGVSSAFISSIELSKKKIPGDFIDKLKEAYDLPEKVCEELQDAADMAKGEILVRLGGVNENDQRNIIRFARRYSNLSPENKKTVMKLINEE